MQDSKLGESEFSLHAINSHRVAIEIDHKFAAEKDHAISRWRRLVGRVCASKHIRNPRHKHTRTEWFRHIIVGAEFNARNDVGLFALGSHHENRNRARLF